jgi:hypothetical protein
MARWTEVPAGQVNAAIQRFLGTLGDMADIVLQRIIVDQHFTDRLALFARNGGVGLPTAQQRAQEIMGDAIFTIERAIKFLGVVPSRRQSTCLDRIPWDLDELGECRHTHLLGAQFPISIFEVINILGAIEPNRHSSGIEGLFTKEFMHEPGEIGWDLLCKFPVIGSLGLSWDEQLKLLKENEEEVPSIQTVVYQIVCHYLATGEPLLENVSVRCSDTDANGNHLIVGRFDDQNGPFIGAVGNDVCNPCIGLLSVMK